MVNLQELAKDWWLAAVLGAISLIAGVLMLVYPKETVTIIGVILGVYLVLAGVVELLQAVLGDVESRVLATIVGVLALLAGLVCLRHPSDSLVAIVIVVALFLVLAGVLALIRAIVDAENRGIRLFGAVCDLVLGVIILAWPKITLGTFAVLVGISFILRGAILCAAAFRLRQLADSPAEPVVASATPPAA